MKAVLLRLWNARPCWLRGGHHWLSLDVERKDSRYWIGSYCDQCPGDPVAARVFKATFQ